MLKKMLLAVTALAIFGCASEPKAEKDAAMKSKEAADKAEAMTYNKAAYDDASGAWDKAESANKAKKYDDAKKGYVDAKAKFDKAATDAPGMKDAMKADLTARMTKLEADHNEKAMADMKKMMMTMKKDEKAKVDKAMADCKANEAAAKEALEKGDLMAAKEKIEADEKVHTDMMSMMKPAKK